MKKILMALLTASFALAKGLVVLDPAAVEIIYALGAQDQIAAIATTSMSKIRPQAETAKLPSVGTYVKPNMEKIVELKPDLVITSFHSAGVSENLRKLGLKSLAMDANSTADICQNVKKVAAIVKKEGEADKICAQMDGIFADKPALRGKKVALFFGSNATMAFNDKTLVGDIFARLGAKNIADGLKGSTPSVSAEYILEQNPDIMVIVGGETEDFLKANPILRNTKAVKSGKILKAPTLILRGSPQIGETVDEIYAEATK